MASPTKRMLYDVHEKPPIARSLILGLQHVFAMFGATVLVPILVNGGAGQEILPIPVALAMSGVGTLIYQLCTNNKSPVYLGSSFAFIAPVIAAAAGGTPGSAYSGIMMVGLLYVVCAIVIKFVGKDWIDKILPPIVIGPMIMIIGLGLASFAISQIGITSGTPLDLRNVIVALVAFLVAVFCATIAKGFAKVIPFLLGIIAGYVVAFPLGIVNIDAIAASSWVGIPAFKIPFLNYNIDIVAALVMAPVALVTISEHIGDHISLSRIIDRDLIKDPGLDKTLMGDGVATFVAGLVGGPANTTYGENTAVVGMTKVGSVWVLRIAAIIAIVLAFFTKFTSIIEAIPAPVLGGISILLYGFIASNGLRVLVYNRIDFGITKNVVIASSMLVLGIGGAAISIVIGDASLTFSGMSLAAIVGILLNVFIPGSESSGELD
ncbi:MAG: NCS2 family nucleobase:cation symporter [Clostridiales bacterium]|nr:NCS2 family nucleobase:cation symporter [Clostridiales bacterium]